jgi:hypothetical protein
VTCSKPLLGKKIRLVTVQNTYLSISGFEAYTGQAQSTTTSFRRPSGNSSKIDLENP